MKFALEFARHEWEWIRSEKRLIFLFLAWPLLYALIFGRIYSNEVVTDIPTAVYDEDHSALSRLMIRSLDATRGLMVSETKESADELSKIVMTGTVPVGIYIPKDFERRVKRGETQNVIAYVDASNLLIANLVSADLRTTIGTIAAGVQLKYLQKTGSSTPKAMAMIQPLKIETARLYNPGLNYITYLPPGVWSAVVYQVLILFGLLCLAPNRKDTRRAADWRLADGKSWKLVAGKLLTYIVPGLILVEILFRIVYPLFGIQFEAPVYRLFIFSALMVVTSLSVGMLLSATAKSTVSALTNALLVVSPAFVLSGYIWPVRSMPMPIRWLAELSPLTPYLSGYRKLYIENAELGYVVPEALHLAAFAVALISLCIFALTKRHQAEPEGHSQDEDKASSARLRGKL